MMNLIDRIAALQRERDTNGMIMAGTQVSANMPRPNEKLSNSPYKSSDLRASSTCFAEPKRPDALRCTVMTGVRHTVLHDGTNMRTPLACGKCENCLRWRIELKDIRRGRGLKHDEQTIVIVSGFDDVDEAADWTTSQGRRQAGQRLRMFRRDEHYTWEGCLVYEQPLEAKEVARIKKAVQKRSGALRCRVVRRRFTSTEFRAYVSHDPIAVGPSGIRRRTCLFINWPGFDDDAPDYLHNDGYVEIGVAAGRRELTELPPWAKTRRKMDSEKAAALNAADWCNVEGLAAYEGPTRLIRDVREWLAGKVEWREAYRPMLALMGEQEKAPAPKCGGCDGVAVTMRGLCVRCDIRAG